MIVLPLDRHLPHPDQPRKEFSERKLEELAQSIRENGLLEPIVVTPRAGRFMIIAGERRFRACRLAGLAEAPVRVIEADDRTVAELALLENLQREDLNLIEEAPRLQKPHGLGLEHGGGRAQDGLQADLAGARAPWISCGCTPPTSATWLNRRISPSQAYEMSRLPEDGSTSSCRSWRRVGRTPTTSCAPMVNSCSSPKTGRPPSARK